MLKSFICWRQPPSPPHKHTSPTTAPTTPADSCILVQKVSLLVTLFQQILFQYKFNLTLRILQIMLYFYWGGKLFIFQFRSLKLLVKPIKLKIISQLNSLFFFLDTRCMSCLFILLLKIDFKKWTLFKSIWAHLNMDTWTCAKVSYRLLTE